MSVASGMAPGEWAISRVPQRGGPWILLLESCVLGFWGALYSL